MKEVSTPDLIPSPSLRLNQMLGGGLPRGRFTSVAGAPNTGKTTLALLFAKHITRNPDEMLHGGRVAFIDAENEYSPEFAYKLGVHPDRMDIFHVGNGELVIDLMTYCILQAKNKQAGKKYDEDYVYDLIILDSVPSVGFEVEFESTADDSDQPALHARQWTSWHRRIGDPLYRSGTAVYAINRIRTTFDKYAPDYLFGGKAWTYKSNTIIKMLSPYKPDQTRGGKGILTLRPKIVRTKIHGERRDTEVDILMDVDRPFVDIVPELTEIGKDLNVFTNDGKPIKGAPYWWFNGEQVADDVGEKPVQERLYQDADFRRDVRLSVEAAIRQAAKPTYTNERTGEVFHSLAALRASYRRE